MPRLKRSAAEAQLDIAAIEDPVPSDPALVKKLRDLRNMWEFASMMQYIYIFGSVVKIDEDFDMEVRPASWFSTSRVGHEDADQPQS